MLLFSQNDPQWKKEKLGKTNLTCGQFGCTTSVIGDGGNWFGETITPYYLTKRLSYTNTGLIIWSSIGKVYKKMQFFWRFYKHDEKMIADALKHPDKVVLLNVDRGYHWVFLLGKVPFLGYRCSNPYPFPAKTRYYKPSEVVGGAVLIRKK